MIRHRNFSAYNDFKTGILYKLMIFLGIIFLVIFIFLELLKKLSKDYSGLLKYFYDLSISNFPGIIISISILLISFGIILYFFNRQFSKLAEIAEEIDHGKNEK
jgi:hypothetical protein